MNTLKKTFTQFSSDDCSTLAAALAYYTIFALPPLLYLLLTVVSLGMSLAYEADEARQRSQQVIESQAAELIGNEAAAEVISTILEQNRRQGGAWWKSVLSVAAILFGATGVVMAVQTSLNRVWKVQPDPQAGSITTFLLKRTLSFAMILGLGFLLLVSMIISTVLAAVGSQVGQWLGLEETLVAVVNYAVTFAATVLVFASLLKFMPDAQVGWRDVWVGALATAVLFSLGRFAMGLYFANTDPGAQLGSAAASLALLLVWVYYSSMIFLLGAEFTQVWATEYGRGIRPEEGAVRVERNLVRSESTATGR